MLMESLTFLLPFLFGAGERERDVNTSFVVVTLYNSLNIF